MTKTNLVQDKQRLAEWGSSAWRYVWAHPQGQDYALQSGEKWLWNSSSQTRILSQ